jgi:hypothetical protein
VKLWLKRIQIVVVANSSSRYETFVSSLPDVDSLPGADMAKVIDEIHAALKRHFRGELLSPV